MPDTRLQCTVPRRCELVKNKMETLWGVRPALRAAVPPADEAKRPFTIDDVLCHVVTLSAPPQLPPATRGAHSLSIPWTQYTNLGAMPGLLLTRSVKLFCESFFGSD